MLCNLLTAPCHRQYLNSGPSDNNSWRLITTLPQRPHHDQDNEKVAEGIIVFRFSSNALNSSKKIPLLSPLNRKEQRLFNSAGVLGTESGEITNCSG